MKTKKNIMKILLLFGLVIGAILTPKLVFADKKATEGQNEANVEFYEPTPPKKTEPKKVGMKPSKLLPKTGEIKTTLGISVIGLVLVGFSSMYVIKKKKVGDTDEE